MNRITVLLLLLLFVSCTGQRNITSPVSSAGLRNNECKTLLRRQQHEYKIAVRESKASQRRKKVNVRDANVSIAPYKSGLESVAPNPGFHNMTTSQDVDVYSNTAMLPNDEGRIAMRATLKPVVSITDPVNEISGSASTLDENLKTIRPLAGGITTFQTSSLPLVAIGIAGLTGIALLKLFEARAQQVSRWAKKHPWKTRGTLAIAQAGMGATSIWLGHQWFESEVMIPEYAHWSAAGMFAVAAILYPSTYYANGSPAFSYLRRKFHDATLFTAGAALSVYAGNHCNVIVQPANPITVAAQSTAPTENIISVKFANRQISVVKKKFETKLKKYFEDPKKGKTHGEKVALTIIASLAFAFLTVGVAAVSCNLSCSGNEGAAILVLMGGAVLIAWGLTASLKSIHRAPTIEKKAKSQPST